ncbi:unnamed protein product [Calicophoron daubneyi]|uniref:Insulin receptor substrate 1 n=1 Tax=Calicophoron daubneyi TaxID=300641 RepID=A0AAV2T1W2_CALDB
MSTIKIRFALQGPVKYRDGRKWKRRYCVLALAPKTEDGMHLYLAKSYDEFAPYRSRGCVVDVQIPSAREDAELSTKLSCTPSSYRYLGQPGDSASLLPTRQASVEYDGSGPLVNTATQSCAAAVESTSLGLSAASNLASTLNAPAPVDEIIGFESGYHMDKESNVIVLIGSSSVYVIAVQSTDEMFRWADTMAKIMTDVRFRVTLRRSVEGSKLPQGIQGSLHIQHWRLCLIGEPSAGCKFICSWRLDCIEKAHTMTSLIGAANSGTSEQQPGTRQLEEDKHRISLGSLSVLNSPIATNLGMSTSTSNSRQGVDRPRHLLILSASHSAGKGRGLHTFELDGGSLLELTSAIERFMALRYNPRLTTSLCPTCYALTSSEAGRPTSSILSKSHSSSHQSESSQSKDLGNNSSLSSDASENLHSVSPAQRFPSKRQTGDLMTYRSSPLTMPAAVGPMKANSLNINHQRNLYGQSVPVLSSSQFTRPAPQYSNVLCSSSSLSPPVSSKHPDIPALGTRTAANQPAGDEHSMSIDFLSRCDDSVLSHSAGSRNSTASLEESIVRPLSQSVSVCSCSACPDQSSSQAAVTRAAWTCPSSSGLNNPINSVNYMRQNLVEPNRNSDPPRVSANRKEFTEVSNPLRAETQVAKVAAGLVIARRPSGSTGHSANMYTRQPPPLPPALESDRGSLNHRPENSSTTNSFLHPVMSVHATDVHSVLSTSFHDGSVCDHVNEEQQIRRRRSYPHQQSLLAQHSDMSSGEGGSAQHGIFSIDEDLWEPDGRCCDRYDDARERLHHTMPANMCTRVLPPPGTLEVLPKSEVSTSGNDGKLAATMLGTARAPVESDQVPVFSLLTKYYQEQLYRLYRHRLRQYRACFCIHCLVRSLSSDALLLLRYDNRLSTREKISQAQSPELARTALSTSTVGSTASPTHSISSRPISGSAYANSSSTVPTGSQTNAGITKTTCGSRLKHINRFFHRKHSKSHDSLRSPNRSVHLVDAENANGKSVGPQIPSIAEGEYATYTPNTSESKPYNSGTNIFEHDLFPIILRCPRHGIRSYRPYSEFVHRFDLARYPRCRKETKQPREPSSRKHSKLRAHHSLTCGLPSSVVSNLLELVRLRNNAQGMKSDTNESVGKGSTLAAPGYPSSAGEMRFLIDLFRSTNGQLPTQSSACESKDHPVSSNIRSSSAHRTQSPKSRNCRLSFDIGLPDIRPHFSLSLTSLSCSEPAFGSRMALPLGYSDLPSHYSSLSSLLTFHSLSGSSSIMSGSHALGDVSTRKTVTLPSVDSTVKISHNSGDVVDGSQPHVSYYPEEPSFESVLVVPGENLGSNPLTTARCGSPLQKVSETDSPLHAISYFGRRGPHWSNSGHAVGRGSPPRVLTDSKKNCTKSYDSRNGETVGERKHMCAKISRKTSADYKLRSSTLPNTSAFRSKFERKSLDEISPIRDDILLNQSIARAKETDDERRIHWLESDGESGRSYSVMFRRGVCPSSQSNIETNVSPVPSNSSVSRKQSIQSDAGTSLQQNEDVGNAFEGHGHCPPNYCNFVPVSNVPHLSRTGPQFQDACTKLNHGFVPHVDAGGPMGNESSRASYVNVPLPTTHQMSEYANCNPSAVNRLNRQQGFVFGSTDVRALSKSSNNRLLLPKSGARATMRTTSCSQQFPSNPAGTIPITTNGHLGLSPADNKSAYPSNASQLSSVPSLYPAIPAEVRDPSRNYAMVDLRPSPASSATVTAELALNVAYHPVHSSLMDELTSVGSSSASILGFSTNTSTGSDCTSDAATLTSETVGSYAAVCPHSEMQPDATSGNTCPLTRPVLMDSTRRRHSHSLSSAVCDPPVLNYVRVIASTTPLTVPDPTLHEDDNTVSDPIACSIPIHSDSPSSSSGLGGVASQSITPPLAPTCASFSEIFNSRSMTSSATSSAEGNGVDAGFQSYSPSDQGCVAYTQIDFARTLALGELCGDIEQDKQVAPTNTSSTQPRPCSTKADRPASMRKTLTRSIRSIRQKSGKKNGSFFS